MAALFLEENKKNRRAFFIKALRFFYTCLTTLYDQPEAGAK
jgi:hypothetical protein